MEDTEIDNGESALHPYSASVPLTITLLMISGSRHNITINSEYILNHALDIQDPERMTVWLLKECIWNDWLQDWGERPSGPWYIRLIHFGRILDDNDSLAGSKLSSTNQFNVLHMSVRPVSTDLAVSPKTAKHRSSTRSPTRNYRRSNQYQPSVNNTEEDINATSSNAQLRSHGCGCIII
ncbi:uncharacterized protein V1510DRAFT_367712 [Dipodascopsis tothii]|uniref:uncharacterized protein n=1 Tax=Dipodascopsis tothii TaxID=44089 RepID=UPI0034CD1108